VSVGSVIRAKKGVRVGGGCGGGGVAVVVGWVVGEASWEIEAGKGEGRREGLGEVVESGWWNSGFGWGDAMVGGVDATLLMLGGGGLGLGEGSVEVGGRFDSTHSQFHT